MPKFLTIAVGMFGIHSGFYAYVAPLPLALTVAGYTTTQVGLVVGFAPLVQVPAALLGGAVIRRFGARIVFFGAATFYAVAALSFVLGVAEDNAALPLLLTCRAMQGIGLGLGLPSALSLVASMTGVGRRGVGLALVASSHNVALAILAPIALLFFAQGGLRWVAAVALVLICLGAFVGWLSFEGADLSRHDGSSAGERPAWIRRRWVPLLTTLGLSTFYFGIVSAYLPQRAEARELSVALFFTADALAIVGSRVPAGLLADRIDPRGLLFVGLGLTAGGLLGLIVPPVPATLLIAGSLCGLGAGVGVTAILVMLHRRSTVPESGSVFGLFSAATAIGLTAGSVVGGFVVGPFGFEAGIGLGLVAILIAGGIAWFSGSRDVSTPVRGHSVPGPAT